MKLYILNLILALLLGVTAYANPPGWTVNPSTYLNSMTFTGVISISGTESMDTNDMVGAFAGTECRGVSKPIFLPAINRCMVFLVVFSNSSSGDNISFKIYDSSGDSIIAATQSLTIGSFISVGSISNPFVWNNLNDEFPIYGQVTYDNSSSTALNGLKLFLHNLSGAIIDSVTCNSLGQYNFKPQPNGRYTISVGNNLVWGGVSSADKVVILRNTVGVLNPPLSALRLLAGDVNKSGTTNAADGTVILRRVVGVLGSFAAGDWKFNPDTININGAAVSMNFKGICIGDVNGSYLPDSKLSNTVNLTKSDSMIVNVGDIINIPVSINHSISTGSVSFFMNYPANILEVLSVNSPLDNISRIATNIDNGKLSIAWGDLQTLTFQPKDIVFLIKAKVLSFADSINLILSGNNEFTDGIPTVFTNVDLIYPNIKISTTLTENEISGTWLNAYPNPADKIINVDLVSKNGGNCLLRLFDTYGQLLKDDQFQLNSGQTTHSFNIENYSAGVYFIVVQDENSRIVRKVIIK